MYIWEDGSKLWSKDPVDGLSGIRSCADKLGGGWERDKVQRTTTHYDDDGDGKDVGLGLMLLAAVIMAAKALPPQPNRRPMTKEKRRGATKLATLRRVRIRISIVCFLPTDT